MTRRKIGLALMGALAMQMAVAQKKKDLKTYTDSVSYALGLDLGASLASQDMEIASKSFMKGLEEGMSEEAGLFDESERMQIIRGAFAKAAELKRERLKAEETAFFEELKTKPGIQAFKEGMYYEVLQEGSGAKPTINDEVTVHYTGTLANGKVFDDSRKRGQPLDLQLANVIRGWQLGIPLMATGAKYRLYIPSALGYGERGAGGEIPPYSALIFDIELIGIKGQEAGVPHAVAPVEKETL